MDHIQRQCADGRLHPAIILGLARRHGIPSLIEPAVRLLARPDRPLFTWASEEAITRHTSVPDIGTIGHMKEKLLLARMRLCSPPAALHDAETCRPSGRTACSGAWEGFWSATVATKLLKQDGHRENELWSIRDALSDAAISGMREKCILLTKDDVIGKSAWNAEKNIPDGAIRQLMVEEHMMLDPAVDMVS